MIPAKNKGFTLVELIVVITILAVLGTIGFLSFSGYAKNARNSVRIDALSSLTQTIILKTTEGTALKDLIFAGQEVISAKLAGSAPIVGGNYKAGVINYVELGLDKADFTDPSYGEYYRGGISTSGRNAFQLAATIETGAGNKAVTKGTWLSRKGITIDGIGVLGTTTFTRDESTYDLYPGDIITGVGIVDGTTVTSASEYTKTVQVSDAFTANVTSINIGDDESLGLIGSNNDPNIPVQDDTFYVPYAADGSVLDADPYIASVGTVNLDSGLAADSDNAGNSYVAGYYNNPGSNNDIFVRKFNSSGALLWTETFGGTGDDQATNIVVDGIGNAYITGYFSNTITFGSGNTLTSLGSVDGYVVKFNGDGDVVWATQMGGTSADKGYGIGLDNSGNILTTGYFSSAASFGSINLSGATNEVGAGGKGTYVAKLNSSGTVTWAKMFNGDGLDESGYYVTSDYNDNVLVGGFYIGSSTHGSTTLTNAVGSPSTVGDGFVTKLDSSGNVLWAKSVGGIGKDRVTGVDADSDGNVYIDGYFDDDSIHGPNTLTHLGSNDFFVTKLDSSGNFIWSNSLSGSSNDTGNGIEIDANDHIYVTGYFGSTSNHGGISIVSAGSVDIFITKMDSDGNVLWANGIGSTGDDRGFGISVDTIGNTYTTGYFNGSITYGSNTITSVGGRDVFIIKLDGNGETI